MQRRAIIAFVALVVVACGTDAGPPPAASIDDPTTTTTTTRAGTFPSSTTTSTSAPATTSTVVVDAYAPPAWLGSRPLPLRPDGYGEVLPTPAELVDRAISTLDLLVPPPRDEFVATIEPIPPAVLARSTWHPDCPVTEDELAYLTMSHWGFDERSHTGEMIIHADHAEAVVGVFSKLHAARFPIEQMRVISRDELDVPPTGDGNVTTAFVCRPAVGATSWSMHASGLAIDINPFHNPYVKADLVVPELASAYANRAYVRPGMILADDVVTAAFAEIGWFWGGRWNSLVDSMHFSANNR